MTSTRATLRFHSEACSLPQARTFVAETLRSWRASETALDDAVLAANELVANAIVHAGTSAEIVLERRGPELLVRVCDGTTSAPQLRANTPAAWAGAGWWSSTPWLPSGASRLSTRGKRYGRASTRCSPDDGAGRASFASDFGGTRAAGDTPSRRSRAAFFFPGIAHGVNIGVRKPHDGER